MPELLVLACLTMLCEDYCLSDFLPDYSGASDAKVHGIRSAKRLAKEASNKLSKIGRMLKSREARKRPEYGKLVPVYWKVSRYHRTVLSLGMLLLLSFLLLSSAMMISSSLFGKESTVTRTLAAATLCIVLSSLFCTVADVAVIKFADAILRGEGTNKAVEDFRQSMLELSIVVTAYIGFVVGVMMYSAYLVKVEGRDLVTMAPALTSILPMIIGLYLVSLGFQLTG
ncbi:hypothetical protein [Methanopyrus sp.]